MEKPTGDTGGCDSLGADPSRGCYDLIYLFAEESISPSCPKTCIYNLSLVQHLSQSLPFRKGLEAKWLQPRRSCALPPYTLRRRGLPPWLRPVTPHNHRSPAALRSIHAACRHAAPRTRSMQGCTPRPRHVVPDDLKPLRSAYAAYVHTTLRRRSVWLRALLGRPMRIRIRE